MRTVSKISMVFVAALLSLVNVESVMAEANNTEHQHSHEQDAHAAQGLTLNHGEKWKTDAPLRKGMQNINAAVMDAVPAYHHETLTKVDADKLAKDINDQVNYLVANCKLEPGADATLHVLIGDLLTAAATISNEPLSPQGLPSIVKTLQQYPNYFVHPDWKEMTEE